jgi:hypothetical protein
MEVYEVKRGTKVIVIDDDIKMAIGSPPVNKGDEITIYRLDGMYCNGINKDGERIYISAFTEVKPI